MKFEKLEQRCVMDGTGLGEFCTSFDSQIPAVSAQIPAISAQNEHVVYGPIKLTEFLEAEPDAQVGDEIGLPAPLTKVEYGGTVTEVSQFNVNGAIVVGKQEVPASTGLRAALDILEANGGYVQEWANDGISEVYRSGDTYYFEFETPLDELGVLGKRLLVVDVGDGTIYGFLRF